MGFAQNILVVEDDPNFAFLVKDTLEEAGYKVTTVGSGEEALEKLRAKGEWDLMLLDLRLPGINGLETLERSLLIAPDLAVILISGHGDIQTAVKAVKKGAYDFLEKPVKSDRLLLTVRRALDFIDLQRDRNRYLEEMRSRYQLIGVSDAMKRILTVVDRVAATDVTVLITGESGVGKEMVARAIHLNSNRAAKPFVQVNCAAIPDTLVESELFGHVKGAFTGALHSHEGKFQQAKGGTLFLDEIGDLSPSAQAKILRAIESREVTKVGGERVDAIDVRLIVATNRDLDRLVREGRFREDLYHRINVVSIQIPPLRQRREDIIPLAETFLKHFASMYNRRPPALTPDAKGVLLSHNWPGNVRELRNVMEKATILLDSDELHGHDLVQLIQGTVTTVGEAETGGFKQAKRTFERTYILTQLERNGWNIARTARAMGVERSHLYKMMERLGIADRRKTDQVGEQPEQAP